MAKDDYKHNTRIDPDNERAIIHARKTVPQFNLNKLINDVLRDYFKKQNND